MSEGVFVINCLSSFRFSCCGALYAKHLPGLDIKFKGNVTLQVFDPIVVACEESAVLFLVRGQRKEGGTGVALFVALQMLGHVVTHE